MSLRIEAHRVESIHLTELKEYNSVFPGKAFFSQELTIATAESNLVINLYYNERPAHCIEGDIVSKEPILLDLDIDPDQEDISEVLNV